MPPVKKKAPVCVACGDTGRNSRGGDCHPCVVHGRIKSKVEKVEHVLKAGQTRDHHCHWPGCGKQVPPAMWGCKRHWFLLPKRLRDRIWSTYRIGQEVNLSPSREYIQVAREVQEWIRQTYGVS